jgi:hypothetical protein
MKIMNVALNIDVANIEHVEALEVFMRTLGGHPMATPLAPGVVMTPVTEEKPEKPARRRAAPKVEPAPAAVEETEEEEEDDDLVGDDAPKVDIAMLRTLTSEKSATHRAEIKAKLVEYGVNNVSSMPEAKYQDYYNFITSL